MFGCHVEEACGPSECCGWKLSWEANREGLQLSRDGAGRQTLLGDGKEAVRGDMELGAGHSRGNNWKKILHKLWLCLQSHESRETLAKS